jgi:TonB family protein
VTATAIERGCASAAGGSGLTSDELRRVIRAEIPRVRACYDAALRNARVFDGAVTVAFDVIADGRTRAVRIESSSVPDPGAQRCVLDVMRSLSFPPPRGGEPIGVRYPIAFNVAE